jgi:hypothetical protein
VNRRTTDGLQKEGLNTLGSRLLIRLFTIGDVKAISRGSELMCVFKCLQEILKLCTYNMDGVISTLLTLRVMRGPDADGPITVRTRREENSDGWSTIPVALLSMIKRFQFSDPDTRAISSIQYRKCGVILYAFRYRARDSHTSIGPIFPGGSHPNETCFEAIDLTNQR